MPIASVTVSTDQIKEKDLTHLFWDILRGVRVTYMITVPPEKLEDTRRRAQAILMSFVEYYRKKGSSITFTDKTHRAYNDQKTLAYHFSIPK